MDKPSEYINYVTKYSLRIRNQIFMGPNTGRPYVVMIICYDKKAKEPVAYRCNLDGLLADPFDDFPLKVVENSGKEVLV